VTGVAPELPVKVTTNAGAPPNAHRIVDFVRAVAMHDERGMEVRIDRAIVGRSVNRESTAKVESIVLDGPWFVIVVGGRTYRVPIHNVVSAER
jgi:hypothetical protein